MPIVTEGPEDRSRHWGFLRSRRVGNRHRQDSTAEEGSEVCETDDRSMALVLLVSVGGSGTMWAGFSSLPCLVLSTSRHKKAFVRTTTTATGAGRVRSFCFAGIRDVCCQRARCGLGRAFASVSRGAVAAPARAIAVGGQMRNCVCRASRSCRVDGDLACGVVAIHCASSGERHSRSTAGAEACVPAATRARRRWRRWRKQAGTAAIAGPSDRTRSTHRARRQAPRQTTFTQRGDAARTTGPARCQAAGGGNHVDDWAARGVALASVLAWARQR